MVKHLGMLEEAPLQGQGLELVRVDEMIIHAGLFVGPGGAGRVGDGQTHVRRLLQQGLGQGGLAGAGGR